MSKLDEALTQIEQNRSAAAIEIARSVYSTDSSCHQVYDVYGYSLFRNGKWEEGINLIERGIDRFGSVPALIERRAFMSLEMAESGTSRKNIDGNAVYKQSTTEAEQEHFKEVNLASCLADLVYLMNNSSESKYTFLVARIYQNQQRLDLSSELFETLRNDASFGFAASYSLAGIYMLRGELERSEQELNYLLEKNPEDPRILQKLAEIQDQKGDPSKSEIFKKQAIYYDNVPSFLDLEYSNKNYELLLLFGTDDHSAEEKIHALDSIYQSEPNSFTADVCLMILNLHSNHGNGVETEATEILKKIGTPAISSVNQLFQTDISTCTVTYLADVMATVKDESSWNLMSEYLPYIAHMPMTLIPPALPEMMVKFDEERGINEILIVVKPLLKPAEIKGEGSHDMQGFGQYVYYLPLKEMPKRKLKKMATEQGYTEEEFEILLGKLD